jgi:dihydrodipicolinate synthase/N-acetylneuraminate lyase
VSDDVAIDGLAARQRIRGVLAPVVTPFKDDLSPDTERFVAHCRWLLSQKCGLAVFGTNSEANSLSIEERARLLDELVAAGIDPTRMMPGTGCCSIVETVKLTARAVGHGCAGVLMLPPFYYKDVSEEGLYRYFSEVVQRVGDARLKIYLYHIPPVAVVGITMGLVERLLAEYPSAIAGMKDSSGDWNNTKTFLDAFVRDRQGDSATERAARNRHETISKSQAARSKSQESFKIQQTKGEGAFGVRAGQAKSLNSPRNNDANTDGSFDVFVGSESFLLANMRNGGVGTISATANVNPAAIYKLYAESKRRTPNARAQKKRKTDDQKLDALQVELNVVRETFTRYPMIAALKQAIAICRNDPGWAKVRPPLVDLTPAQAKTLAAELSTIGFRWRE